MKFEEYFNLKDITINTTNACNLKCKYCFEHNKNNQRLDNGQMEIILDKCWNNYILHNDSKQPFVVNFFGGEPFMNWKVIEHALKYAKDKHYNMEFNATTNLTILTDHMIDIIEEYNLGLLVSIDGVKEIHDRNRCNTYDLVKTNVQRLVDKHLEYLLEARMTLMPKDTSLLLKSIQSIIEMGIVNIAPVPVTDTLWNDEDLKSLKENLSKVWEWLINIYNTDDNKQNISIKFIEDYIEKVMTIQAVEYQTKSCTAGSKLTCSIGANGDIMPCHQRHTVKNNYELMLMGNIFDNNDIKDVSFNDCTRHSEEDCDKCLARNICIGGCPSENWSVNGYGNIMNKNQCEVFKAMIEVAIDYQDKILHCSNLRSHRLISIKENLQLLEYFKTNVLEVDKHSKKYLNNLMKFYEMLSDKQGLLLPLFEETFMARISELININKEIMKGLK